MKLGGSLQRTRASRRKGQRRRSGGPSGAGRGSRRLARLLAGVAVASAGWAGGYLVATRVVFPAPPPPENVVEVPDVRGVGLTAARERLDGPGLKLGAVDSLHHPSAPPGSVLGQAPLPGQLATPGAEVRVTVSLGPQMRAVPDVERLGADRARLVLESTGFVVAEDSVESELPRGRVVAVDPPPDSVVALPAEVHLQVSTGPPTVVMPLLLGLEREEALATLDSLGLTVAEVAEVFRFGRDQGIVVEQEPAADTELERGSAVRLAVGRGRRR